MDRHPFHYTACGRDQVWLLDGVTLRTGKHGPTYAIPEADQLHELIRELPDDGRRVEFRLVPGQGWKTMAGETGSQPA